MKQLEKVCLQNVKSPKAKSLLSTGELKLQKLNSRKDHLKMTEYVFFNESWKKDVDGKNSSCIARLFNDCGQYSKPNCAARIYTDKNNQKQIKFVAPTFIENDEEITYNYGGSNLPWREKEVRETDKYLLD